jgi:hypothetical protein
MSFGLVEGNRRRYDEANAENIDSFAPDRFDHSKPATCPTHLAKCSYLFHVVGQFTSVSLGVGYSY